MPGMLRSKASNSHLSATANRHTGSQTDLLEVQNPPRPSSRLASFANFRRNSLLPVLSGSASPSSSPNSKVTAAHTQVYSSPASSYSRSDLSKGGVDDVPLNAAAVAQNSSRIPVKPPKPVGLRVKKAKALSISLLNAGSNRIQSVSGARTPTEPKTAHSYVPPTLQEALAAEDDAYGRYPADGGESSRNPTRSASALDLYRAYGPMKGLLSSGGAQDAERSASNAGASNLPVSSKYGGGDVDGDDREPSKFLRRRRSTSLTLDKAPEAIGKIPGQPGQQSGVATPWKLDTARELLSDKRWGDAPHSAASQAPQDSTGPNAPYKTNSRGVTASPFLNKFSARAKMEREQGHRTGPEAGSSSTSISPSPPSPPSRIPRHKSSATHLGKADILRSTHRPSMESVSSGYQSPRTPSSPLRKSRRPTSSSSRTSIALSEASPTKARGPPQSRTRTQSHAGGMQSSPRLQDSAIPRHPLTADASDVPTAAAPRPAAAAPKTQPPLMRHDNSSRVSAYDGLQPRTRIEVHGGRPGTAASSNGSFANGASLQNISSQIGGMGAAVGKRGWDMFKQWSASGGQSSGRRAAAMASSISLGDSVNSATRTWLRVLHDPAELSDRRGIFGKPLKEAVLLTRLGAAQGSGATTANRDGRTSIAMDLGSEFKIELGEIEHSPKMSRQHATTLAVNREAARLKYLPGVVVRCIQAVEEWGIGEEGVYRLSGRSSHTVKLRQIFNTVPAHHRSGKVPQHPPVCDLHLSEVSPADMDLNSVSGLLKSYLRELPDSLIPEPLASELNALLESRCGVAVVGLAAPLGPESDRRLNDAKALKAATTATTVRQHTVEDSQKIARLVCQPLRNLPPSNWYLLRELAMHLADLTRPEVVAQTRMPLNNLCLVLAPTLSLSVPMIRAMAEAGAEMFGRLGPTSDEELDALSLPRAQASNAGALRSTFAPRLDVRHFSQSADVDDDKRLSVSTVTADKRESVSSVATVLARPPAFHPASPFDASFDDRLGRAVPEEEGQDVCASPIAARFIRQRNGSIAGSLNYSSLGSDQGSVRRPSGSGSMPKPTAQPESSTAFERGSNDHSSGPPSVDGFSSAASSLTPSMSSSSLRTSSALALVSDTVHSPTTSFSPGFGNMAGGGGGGGGGLDRPRPPTGASAKFMGGRPLGKERSGGASAHHHRSRSRSDSVLESASPATSTTTPPDIPATLYHLPHDADGAEEGDQTVQAIEKLVDEEPVNVRAVREFWNERNVS